MNGKRAPQLDWLLKNHASIRWQLKVPDVNNPFDSAVNPASLDAYAHDRNAALEVCEAQALMDDTMLIKISNLEFLEYESEHPNLIDITPQDLKQYLTETGVGKKLMEDLARFQSACRSALENQG